MKWYREEPEEGELVVATISDVDKNSAYAELEEYPGTQGLIHISEVARSWVQDVSKELSEGEKTVAQVVEEGDTPSLSLKRVSEGQKKEKMSQWNREKKAEKFADSLAETLDMEGEEVYEEVIFPMQREFGSSFTGFEISVGEEERLEELFDGETVEAIQEVARENIDLKREKLEGEITLKFHQEDGIDRIKKTLDELEDGVEVKYVSAPDYSITAWGRNTDIAKKRMEAAVDTARERAEELEGEFGFERA